MFVVVPVLVTRANLDFLSTVIQQATSESSARRAVWYREEGEGEREGRANWAELLLASDITR